MNTRKLRRLLDDLLSELADTSVQDPELEQLLDSTAQQIQRSISELDEANSADLDHESLRARANEALQTFETTHPKLTSVLSDILSALSENRI